jgi:hypothetical protein
MTFTLEDYLISLHSGSWFGFNNVTNDNSYKTYANLVIHDDTKSKPSESDCTAGVAALQDAYDGDAYKRTRAAAYPELKEQLDLLYHDMAADKGDKTGEWFKAVKAVKDANAKPS